MPVVTVKVADRLAELAPNTFQRVPVSIQGNDDYETINVLRLIKTINEKLSEISWWTKEDNVPAKTGTYAAIGKIVLNQEQVKESHIFRLKDWEPPLIVSGHIKEALEEMSVTGIKFKEISIV